MSEVLSLENLYVLLFLSTISILFIVIPVTITVYGAIAEVAVLYPGPTEG